MPHASALVGRPDPLGAANAEGTSVALVNVTGRVVAPFEAPDQMSGEADCRRRFLRSFSISSRLRDRRIQSSLAASTRSH